MEAYNNKKILTLCLLIFGLDPKAPTMLANAQALWKDKRGSKGMPTSVSGHNPLPLNPPCCSTLSNADLQCLRRFKDSG